MDSYPTNLAAPPSTGRKPVVYSTWRLPALAGASCYSETLPSRILGSLTSCVDACRIYATGRGNALTALHSGESFQVLNSVPVAWKAPSVCQVTCHAREAAKRQVPTLVHRPGPHRPSDDGAVYSRGGASVLHQACSAFRTMYSNVCR